MVPRPTRRQYLGSLSLAAVGALTGCLGAASSGDDPTSEATPTSTTADPTTGSADGSPAAAFREYLETATEEPAAVRDSFHPIHPFSPANLTAAEAAELFGDASPPRDVSLETDRRDLSGEAVLRRSFLRHTDLAANAVASAVEGERTAVVTADVTQADGDTEDNRLVMVTHDGEWVILAQAFRPGGRGDDAGQIAARVVDDVTFDTDEDTARVAFVDSPVADEVTARAADAFSERSTTSPGAFEYVSLQVAPDGDTLLVTATVDGETRAVHRAQYPPGEAVVEEITYDDDPESDARDATARVTFNEGADREPDALTVEATVSGYEATFEPGGAMDYAVAGVDPGGDEIVVSATVDGESTVVHRERYHP